MKLGHNDHFVVWVIICTWYGSDPPGAEGRGQMVLNSAKSSNDFSSETTGQVGMTVGYNDHLVVEIRIYTWKGYYDDSGPKLLKHVQNAWCSGDR